METYKSLHEQFILQQKNGAKEEDLRVLLCDDDNLEMIKLFRSASMSLDAGEGLKIEKLFGVEVLHLRDDNPAMVVRLAST